ncbi:MAG: YeeE/YedE family protein [Rhodospirillales bacterium]|nr:YeeE/YedE family protein [Rhodospirillales bacterium]MDP6773291.1 YeeE/YedE family protein [Rhodospirillales bacterium]
MTTAALAFPRVQRPVLVIALVVAAALFVHLLTFSPKHSLLLLIGLGLGVALYHAAFGFTGAYRQVIVEGDISGVTAQLVMLAAATVLFAPILAQGEAFGHGAGGAVAPVGISMALGAFVFGIGMQLGSGCASGTLFAAGGGNLRMILVLAFFCTGAFWASLHMDWWWELPELGSISLAETLGYELALPIQLGVLGLIFLILRTSGGTFKKSLWWDGEFSWRRLLHGPWPLLFSAALLAALNWAVLLVAGHAWTITWAFGLWAAKVAVFLGWDPLTSPFWTGGFQEKALMRSLLLDNISVINFGIVLGALGAASLAGKAGAAMRLPRATLVASLTSIVIGGLLMGYGARLAYGCNIGAFFSGVASTSLHGWVWILMAIPGNVVGVYLRPLFGMDGRRLFASGSP